MSLSSSSRYATSLGVFIANNGLATGKAHPYSREFALGSHPTPISLCLLALFKAIQTTIDASSTMTQILEENTAHQNKVNLSLLQHSLVPVGTIEEAPGPPSSYPGGIPPITGSQIVAQNIQALNQQVTGHRSWLTQQVTGLQNIASLRQTQINTDISEIIQTTDTATAFLQLLNRLTYKALCVNPPQ